MRAPWHRQAKLVNLADNRPRGVSGIPPMDSEGRATDTSSAVRMPGGGVGGGGFLNRVGSSFKSFLSTSAASTQASEAMTYISPWLSNTVWTISRAYFALAREAYGTNAVVHACLRLLGSAVAEPPLIPHQVDDDGEYEELDYNHALYKLIRNPNPLMTTHEFVDLIVKQMGIAGRTHWYKQRNTVGKVIALWPLRPDRVGPLYAQQSSKLVANYYGFQEQARVSVSPSPTNVVTGAATPIEQDNPVLAGWTYWPPGVGTPFRIPRQDIMTINLPALDGESGGVVEGLGPIQVLAREIEADNEATSFVAALLKNSAVPGAIISSRANLERDQVARFKREFKRAFGGSKRGDVAVFDGDTQFTQIAFNMQELEFPNLRKVSESRISACLGIPNALVGFVVGTESANRSTLAEYREYFAETTCPDWWRRIQEAFTRDVASEFADDFLVEFDLSKVKALTVQSNRQIQPFQVGFQAGAVTVDEYRVNVLQLDPLPDGKGNVLYIPTVVTPSVDPQPPAEPLSNTVFGTDDQISNNIKPSQESDMDPRAQPATPVRPARGGSTQTVYQIGAGDQNKSVVLKRRKLKSRTHPWLQMTHWTDVSYKVIESPTATQELPPVSGLKMVYRGLSQTPQELGLEVGKTYIEERATAVTNDRETVEQLLAGSGTILAIKVASDFESSVMPPMHLKIVATSDNYVEAESVLANDLVSFAGLISG